MSHIERGDDFHLVLPSNVLSSSENTPSHYQTRLINTINLAGLAGNRWEVGLVEISFINSIKTIDRREQLHICQKQAASATTVQFSPKDTFLEMTNSKISANILKMEDFDKVIKHTDFILAWHQGVGKFSITITNPDVSCLTMSPRTAFILGFVSNKRLLDTEYFYTAEKDITPSILVYQNGQPFMAPNEARFQTMVQKTKESNETSTGKTQTVEEILNRQRMLWGKPTPVVILGPSSEKEVEPFEFMLTPRNNAEYRVSKSITIPEGFYQTSQKLVEATNKALTAANESNFTFAYDENNNRISYKSTAPESTFLQLDNSIASVFGFAYTAADKVVHLTEKEKEAAHPPDLRRGIYSLYVYCDLCMETYVGNALVPLLRTVSYNGRGGFGETITVLYDNPIYVPLNKHAIDNIEVSICDDSGHLVPFVEGKSVLTLHFRRA